MVSGSPRRRSVGEVRAACPFNRSWSRHIRRPGGGPAGRDRVPWGAADDLRTRRADRSGRRSGTGRRSDRTAEPGGRALRRTSALPALGVAARQHLSRPAGPTQERTDPTASGRRRHRTESCGGGRDLPNSPTSLQPPGAGPRPESRTSGHPWRLSAGPRRLSSHGPQALAGSSRGCQRLRALVSRGAEGPPWRGSGIPGSLRHRAPHRSRRA
jgi:hypothetical protein